MEHFEKQEKQETLGKFEFIKVYKNTNTLLMAAV